MAKFELLPTETKTRTARGCQPPKFRRKCANCLNRHEEKSADGKLLYCRYDGFKVEPEAICDLHARA